MNDGTAGFSRVTLRVSPSPIHAPRDFSMTTFVATPLRLVTTAPPVATRRCENPADPVDLLAAFRKRLAAYQAERAHRQRRADWYLCQRAQRTNR